MSKNFQARTLSAAGEDTTTSSSHIGDTVPAQLQTSAYVTLARDVTRLDVQLMQKDIRSAGLQVSGQPQGGFGVVAAIAEESGWRVSGQGGLRAQ